MESRGLHKEALFDLCAAAGGALNQVGDLKLDQICGLKSAKPFRPSWMRKERQPLNPVPGHGVLEPSCNPLWEYIEPGGC
jgi:hypothetical protein